MFGKKKKPIEVILKSPNAIEQNKEPTLSVIPQLSQKEVVVVKWIMFTLWLPLSAFFFTMLLIMLNKEVIKVSNDVEVGIVSSTFVLLGFAINSRLSLFQLRDSNSLAPLKKTKHWLIQECSQVVGIFCLFSSVIFGMMNLLLVDKANWISSASLSLFYSATTYSLISYFSGNKFNLFT